MDELKIFRKNNNLTQDELGSYLGMKKSFISKVENGKEKLPDAKYQKLLFNDKGWDTSVLVNADNTIKDDSSDLRTRLAVLEKENELLREQNEFLKSMLQNR